jgi:hypothetical protein
VRHTEISQDVLQQLPLLHTPCRDGLDHGIVLVQLQTQGVPRCPAGHALCAAPAQAPAEGEDGTA